MSSILIIGAGLSGLIAARDLTRLGHAVVVLDKGRGVGGRLATRRIGDARADHGAQYLTATTPDFQALVDELLTANIIRQWPAETPGHPPRYVGVDGMSGIAKYLAQGLDVRLETRATRLEPLPMGDCRVHTNDGQTYDADALMVTIPAPQALTLLFDSPLLVLPLAELSALQKIDYRPCLTVMATLNTAPTANQLSVLSRSVSTFDATGEPIAWIAENQQKSVSAQPVLTIQTGPVYSQTHFDDDLPGVGIDVMTQIAAIIPPDAVQSVQVHRWRYSLATQRHPDALLRTSAPFPLLFGGDGFGPGNLEGAFLSGKELAAGLMF
jgi:renalase